MILISVIIPVFNVRDYLLRCLQSVNDQTYPHYEVIIVNDGSTDGSDQIAADFIRDKPRFRMINISNKGPASAKNIGLKYITGDYVCFVDSDDYISTSAFATIVSLINEFNPQPDIICCNITYINNDNEVLPVSIIKKKTEKGHGCDGNTAISQLLISQEITPFVADKFFHKNLFCNEDVFFPEGHYYEEVLPLIRLFKKSIFIYLLPFRFYFYLQRDYSISHSFSGKHLTDRVFMVSAIKKELEATSTVINKRYIEDFIIRDGAYFIYYNLYLSRLQRDEYKRLYYLFKEEWRKNGLSYDIKDFPFAGRGNKLFMHYAFSNLSCSKVVNNLFFRLIRVVRKMI